MAERPILFSGPMVRALLEGRKTQTRRIAKVERVDFLSSEMMEDLEIRGFEVIRDDPDGFFVIQPCPFGKPGDLLWIRETFGDRAWYSDLGLMQKNRFYYAADGRKPEWKYKPSIHMPRIASRLTLEIENVRLERLHDISEADKLAEGGSPERPFGTVWKAINTKPGVRWEDNPWVWALTFRVHHGNVDSIKVPRAATAQPTR